MLFGFVRYLVTRSLAMVYSGLVALPVLNQRRWCLVVLYSSLPRTKPGTSTIAKFSSSGPLRVMRRIDLLSLFSDVWFCRGRVGMCLLLAEEGGVRKVGGTSLSSNGVGGLPPKLPKVFPELLLDSSGGASGACGCFESKVIVDCRVESPFRTVAGWSLCCPRIAISA